MARRKLYWHIGMPQAAREVVGASLEAHRTALDEVGIGLAATPEEVRLATAELLRIHRDEGLSRADVDGRWARICDRVWAHKGVSLLSTPDLCTADKDQLALALNPLIGIEVHLVVTAETLSQQLFGAWLAELRRGGTTGWDTYVERVLATDSEGESTHEQTARYWAGHELVEVLSRWGWTLRPERIHVVASADPARLWQEYAAIAGLPDSLAHEAVVPAYADPAGVAVLRRVNRELDSALPAGTARLLLSPESPEDRWPLPVADASGLRPRVETWASALADAGYDVRGDMRALVGDGEATPLPRPRDQLGTAIEALAEALDQNSRLRTVVAALEADNARLDRKRRKHKRRLRALASQN